MQPNILLEGVSTTVAVGGTPVSLNTSHRTGIQVMRLVDDPAVSEEEKAKMLLVLYFARLEVPGEALRLPQAVSANPQEAVEAALSFFNLNEPRPPVPASSRQAAGVRTFDWDWDAGRVLADFQREYGIDLTNPRTRLHWWRFWSLFRGLSEGSQTMEAIRVRAAVPDEKRMGREAVEDLMRRKAALMLPARTKEEAAQLTSIRYRWALDM